LTEITTLFFDLGGVLLTNGWDRHSRRHCVESFGLDYEEFRDRHEFVADAFETGRMPIGEYLERTVFYRRRDFTPEAFREAMIGESEPLPDALAIVEELAGTGRYLLATLNNESRELNQARIERFGLRRYFTAFFSSGFLGVKKPDQAIFRLALQITQRPPEECVFIDDRDLNLECAVTEGMATVHYENPGRLRHRLAALGIEIGE
jgi:putative hydrolase of the HAD superfamily